MAIIRADEVHVGDTHPLWGRITFAGRNSFGQINIASGPLNAALFDPSDPIDIVRRSLVRRGTRLRREWERRQAGIKPVWRETSPLAETIRFQYEREYPS